MSSFRNETITCPSCNHEAPFRVWDSVNVTLDPDMKEQFLSGQLFHWICPECGQRCYAPYLVLYHDMDNQIMTWFDPDTPIEVFREYVLASECGLDYRAISLIQRGYENKHEGHGLYFDHLEEATDETSRMLIFKELDMVDGHWTITDRLTSMSFADYEKALAVVETSQPADAEPSETK